VTLLCLLFKPTLRIALFAAFALTSILVSLDTHRLHPWVYQYSITSLLAALVLHKSEKSFSNAFLLILAATYFYSGAQKLNPIFISETFPYLLRPVAEMLSLPKWVFSTGIIAALFEMFLGLGLLFKPTRKFAAIGILLMHCFILLVLGPLGHGYNASVWPWNLSMIALVSLTSFGNSDLSISKESFKSSAVQLSTLLFVILPSLSFIGLWPSYLSVSLYSGNVTSVSIIINEKDLETLPSDLKEISYSDHLGNTHISIPNWAYQSLNSPGQPERIPLVAAAHVFCGKYLNNNGTIEVSPRLLLWGENLGTQRIPCAQSDGNNSALQ